MLRGINEILLTHLATEAGVASVLRNSRPKLIALARRFFEARTDIKRLEAAQQVAQDILLRHDLKDMIKIRDIVARQELRRLIEYRKQLDHTAHTVYVFFLGLWLYDHLPQISKPIKNVAGSGDPDDYFLLQWIYASLLHDIGYLFYNLESETRRDRQIVDNIFSLKWVRQQATNLSPEAEKALNEAVSTWTANFAGTLPPGTATYGPNQSEMVLLRLAQVPWAGQIVHEFKEKDGFDILDPEGWGLREYALSVARHGYDGSKGCVDHAVASGLLLFQYTSFWYWLMEHVRRNSRSNTYQQLAGGFDYRPENLITDLASACRAVAFHNIQPRVKESSLIIPRFQLDRTPIVFLSVLCDELQKWERYPAGSSLLQNYRAIARADLDSDDIALRCERSWAAGRWAEHPIAVFGIRSPRSVARGRKLVRTLKENLQQRLPGFQAVATVELERK